MLRKIVIALALMLAGPAMAQTVLAPPSVKWAGQFTVPTPVQNIGYDSGSGLPCIIGSTATCAMPTSGGGGGGGAVYGPTAKGSAAANPPVLTGGTIDGTATGAVGVSKVDASGNSFVTVATALPAGSNSIGAVTVSDGAGPLTIDGSGTAGSPATGVVTVQGIAGGTAQPANITQVLGSAVAATNPIYTAGADGTDATGTFTNGTQTTSVTASNTDGFPTATVSVNGTFTTATAVFEQSDDGGTTFYPASCARTDGTAIEQGYTTLTTTNRLWVCPTNGSDAFRVRSTAVATGTVNVRISASNPGTTATASVVAQGNVASGATDIGPPVKIGCVNNTTLPTVTTGQRVDCQADTNGVPFTRPVGVAATGTDAFSNTLAFWVSGAAPTAAKLPPYAAYVSNGSTWDRSRSIQGADGTGLGVTATAIAPQSASTGAITSSISASSAATSLIAKNGAGNYYDAYCQSTAAGRCIVYNSTTVPGAGALTAASVLDCAVVAAGGQGSVAYGDIPRRASTGIVILFSSSTDCNTYTASSTAYIHASVQ